MAKVNSLFKGFFSASAIALSLCSTILLAADHPQKQTHQHTSPSITVNATVDHNGRLWTVSSHDDRIWLRHSDDFGKTFSEEIAVNTEKEKIAADGDNRPKIIVTPNQNIYISYTKVLEKPYTGNIQLLHSTDGGKTFTPPAIVNDNREIISHRFEAMQINQHGDLWLAWLDKRDLAKAERERRPYAGAALYYAQANSQDKVFKSNIKLADNACECCRVAMAIDPDGVPIVFWRHVFGKNIRDHAMLRLDGKSSPIRVSQDNWQIDACPHHGPAMSIGPDDTYHFVWFTAANNQPQLIYRFTTDRGTHFSKPMPFGDANMQLGHPDVLSTGKAVTIAWKAFDGKATTIYVMQSSDGGKHWNAAKSIATTQNKSDYPLLVGYQGKTYLSWHSNNEGYRFIPLEKKQANANAH